MQFIDDEMSAGAGDAPITGRELETLKYLAEGYGIEETAAQMNIRPATVRKHRERLHRKLGTSNTAILTRIAVRMGLVAD